ncbi:hypothetical protein EVAR_5608_1 [Eumeta japonica]|uniref:Uncharacterized protein n=1 Tax=Eumeta variegata TaxID=151549 RepID=A0A4C1U1Z7_EUMVA|nr:hypothetical protein EVAR_5608_1 [Eumeta japonica]
MLRRILKPLVWDVVFAMMATVIGSFQLEVRQRGGLKVCPSDNSFCVNQREEIVIRLRFCIIRTAFLARSFPAVYTWARFQNNCIFSFFFIKIKSEMPALDQWAKEWNFPKDRISKLQLLQIALLPEIKPKSEVSVSECRDASNRQQLMAVEPKFSPCERAGEGGEKPIMGRPCARAHRCVRLSQTKNLLNNVNLQWREQNAITPSFKTRPYDMEMPSARDCPMGVFFSRHLGIGLLTMYVVKGCRITQTYIYRTLATNALRFAVGKLNSERLAPPVTCRAVWSVPLESIAGRKSFQRDPTIYFTE